MLRAHSIHAAIFDVGNVLLKLQPIQLTGLFRPDRSGAAEEGDPLALIRNDPALARLERGLATEEEFLSSVFEKLGGRLTRAVIREAYLSILGPPMAGMAELLGELRERGVRLIGLSDISPGHLQRIQDYPAVRVLRRVVASCETGHRKPEPEAYFAALRETGTRPEETLFVDDRPENVAGALCVGLRAVQFEGTSRLRARLGL